VAGRVRVASANADGWLWVDCTAGALVGVFVLAVSGGLARLHGLPEAVLVVLGMANLLYAAYSCTLARRPRRTLRQIEVLAVANAAWGLVCVGLAVQYWTRASAFGFVHLFAEAAFVGVLAAMEWRQRHRWVAGLT
jgi:hypothetical protein